MSWRFLFFVYGPICLAVCAAGLIGLSGCASVNEMRRRTGGAIVLPHSDGVSPSVSGRQEELWIIEKPATARRSEDPPRPASNMLLAASPDSNQLVHLPLKHTDVRAAITGCIASVRVKQAFYNPFTAKIEATYTFPLPDCAVVDEFLMTIGDRTIRGVIRERDQAQRLYRAAQSQGYAAALLTLDRSNAIVHHVANIEPGRQIDIDIQYFHALPYRDNFFEFRAPVAASSRAAVAVDIDAGVKIEQIECVSHSATIVRPDASRARATLAAADQNADANFFLRYRLAGAEAKARMIAAPAPAGDGGYFALMVIPPLDADHQPRRPAPAVSSGNPSGSSTGGGNEDFSKRGRSEAGRLHSEDKPSRTNAAPFSARAHMAMTNLKVDYGPLVVDDVLSAQLPDLCVGGPVMVVGRYVGTLPAAVAVEGQNLQLQIPISHAQPLIAAEALPAIWARLKIADLSDQAKANPISKVQAQITELAMRYSLLSDFTAFVAVDSLTRTASEPRRQERGRAAAGG